MTSGGLLRRMEHLHRYVRLAAFSLIFAGIAIGLADLQHLLPIFRDDTVPFSQIAPTRTWAIHTASHLLGAFALLLGLPAVYLTQAHKLKWGGLVAFAAALLGTAAYVGVVFVMAFAAPILATSAPTVLDGEASGPIAIAFLAYPIAAFSMLALMVVTLRAKVHPRWAAALVGVGGVLEFVGDGVGVPLGTLQAIGLVWLGLAMRTARAGPAPVGAAASA